MDIELDAPPIESIDELTEWFASGEKPADGPLLVGTEHEKLGFFRDSLEPADYPRAIGPLLEGLQRFGWVAPDESGPVVALSREDEAISLEPGGQFELAGGPRASLHDAAADLHRHIREVAEVADEIGLGFAWLGIRPFEAPEDLPWMPKGRYRHMYSQLDGKGRRVVDMMLASATVQANFDYVSEADMVDKIQCGMMISPIVAGIFANSPYYRGGWDGRRSSRYAAWREVDPARCGLLHEVFAEDFGYRAYVEHVIDLPVIFFRREGNYIELNGRTFRDLIANGVAGHRANIGDFISHLSGFFPEIRLKKFLEVRSADLCKPDLAMALVALWKGVLYDAEARRDVRQLFERFAVPGVLEAMQFAVCQDGLRAHGVDWHALELARELVRIAGEGLSRQSVKDDAGRDESKFLDALEVILATGNTAADELLARHGPGPFDDSARRALLEDVEVRP
jgi:glutamate--cysteine ligase